MARTFLALGSNLGDRMAHLATAVSSLPAPARCSRVYETVPVDAPEGSPRFLNAMVEIDYEPDERALIQLVRRLESQANRVRGEPNGPRTLDVDVIHVDGMTATNPDMLVPHPRCRERAFVIAPLSDLDPDLARDLNPAIAETVLSARRVTGVEVYPGVVVFAESI